MDTILSQFRPPPTLRIHPLKDYIKATYRFYKQPFSKIFSTKILYTFLSHPSYRYAQTVAAS